MAPQLTAISDDGWVEGKVGNYVFSAMVYETPSEYGINSGKVSYLQIRDQHDEIVTNYDRSWDIKPGSEHVEIFNTILIYLENVIINREPDHGAYFSKIVIDTI